MNAAKRTIAHGHYPVTGLRQGNNMVDHFVQVIAGEQPLAHAAQSITHIPLNARGVTHHSLRFVK